MILNGMALALIPVLTWTLRQLRAGARRKIYAGLFMVGSVSLALAAIGSKLLIETEITILHASGQGKLLHNRSFLVLAAYALLGVWMLLATGSAARLGQKSLAVAR